MAGNIKGITIEIGGNTGPLQKALDGVNKTSRDLQSELRQVEKLLKLDPTNTELLAQKQKLLAESVDNTKNKLNALKEAEKQVQQQVKDGKVSEEQYRAFQREVTSTEQKLKGLESQAKQSNVALTQIATATKKFGESATNAGQKMLPATVAIVGLGAASIKSASDLNESLNKVDVAFKTSSDEVKKWSDTTLEKFGIAKGSSLDMAALFGDMGTAMGQTPEQAEKISTSLVGLAGDLASFKNIGIGQAQDALKGIFTGEGESLKSLGVIMQESTLKEYALSQGIKKKYEDMTQGEKVQLRYNYVMEMTKNAQGDFARTSDGTANSTRVLGESLKEMSAQFGQVLLPIITPIIQKISEFVQWLGSLDTSTRTIILVVAGVVAAIGPLLIIIGSIASGISALIPIMVALTGPIGLIVLAIGALIAIGVLLYKNWDTVKEVCVSAWDAVTSKISGAIDRIKIVFNTIIDFVKNNWQALLLLLVNPFAGGFKLLYDNCEGFRNFINEFIAKVVGYFKELPGKVWNAIIGIKDKFGNLKTELLNWAKTDLPIFILKFVSFMDELPKKMLNIGKNIVSGIWDGITGMVGWLKDKIGGFVGGIVDGIKDKLQIHSPSKLLADEVGSYMAQGIGMGFKSEMSSVSSNMAKAIPTTKQDYINNSNIITSPTSVNAGSNFAEAIISTPVILDGKVLTNVVSKVQYSNGRTRARGIGVVTG